MKLKSQLQKLFKGIAGTLKRVPERVEVEIGVRWEPIPKPVVNLYAKVRLLKERKAAMQNGSRKESNKRIHNNDASVSERNET